VHDLAALGPDRHADADFLGPLGDRIREHRKHRLLSQKLPGAIQAGTTAGWHSYRMSISVGPMPEKPLALLQGTLDLLILKALASRELHGLGVSRRIDQITGGTFVVQPGSLFPALHRLEEAGWLTSTWQISENNRRAKYYTLTKAGRRQLGDETAQWDRIAAAMARALEA